MNNGKKACKWQIILIVLLAIQLFYMIYWGTQKAGYYVDEFFTFDNAHYISACTPNRVKLYDADFLTYDEWHEVADIKSTLTVSREESLLADPFGYNVKTWINKGPYSCLLNYVQATFFDGKLSKWSAISLNILLFILNQIALYVLTLRISKNKLTAVFATAIYGFSGMAASMTVYVRFYMLITLWMTLFALCHVLMWESDHLKKNLIFEVLTLIALYLAYKNSPLSVIYGVGLIITFLVALVYKKRYLQAACYGIPVIGGGLFYATFMTNYMKYFLNPTKYVDAEVSSSATASLLSGLTTLNFSNVVSRVMELAHVICRYLFGHALVVSVYLFLAAFLLFFCIRRRKERKTDGQVSFWLVFCPCVFFCVVSVCLNLGTIRYNSCVFPGLAVCAAVSVMYLAEISGLEKPVAGIMIAVILGELFMTVSIPRVEYLYREDQTAIEKVGEYQEIDSVVVDYHFDDKVMYECLAYADEDTRVLFTSYDTIDYSTWGDCILVWQSVNQDQKVRDELPQAGYTMVREVGRTHESVVYLAER